MKELVRCFKLTLVILIETHVQFIHAEKLWERLGYFRVVVEEAWLRLVVYGYCLKTGP